MNRPRTLTAIAKHVVTAELNERTTQLES